MLKDNFIFQCSYGPFFVTFVYHWLMSVRSWSKLIRNTGNGCVPLIEDTVQKE